MNKRTLLSLNFLFLTISMLFAQELPEGLLGALRKGDAEELGNFMSDKICLMISNHQEETDKQKAIVVIRTFFSENKVSGFTMNHQGKRNDSSFFIGTLLTNNGKYRINCFFRKTTKKYWIHQIRIDKTNE